MFLFRIVFTLIVAILASVVGLLMVNLVGNKDIEFNDFIKDVLLYAILITIVSLLIKWKEDTIVILTILLIITTLMFLKALIMFIGGTSFISTLNLVEPKNDKESEAVEEMLSYAHHDRRDRIIMMFTTGIVMGYIMGAMIII